MIQVKIKDKASQVITHEGHFENSEEANNWIQSIESQSVNPWGLPQREKEFDSCSEDEINSAIDIIEQVTEFIDDIEIVIKPKMALRGVRSSWFIVERKTLLARLAASAASAASFKAISALVRSVVSIIDTSIFSQVSS